MAFINLLSDYNSYTDRQKNYSVFFKGSIHIDNQVVDVSRWIDSIIGVLSDKDQNFQEFILSELKRISGLYSLIIIGDGKIYLASDIIRSLPIFYGIIENDILITSSLDNYQNQYGILLLDDDKLEEYISTGFVFGNGTIFKDIYGIQAGELVIIDGNEFLSERYFEFKPAESISFNKSQDDFANKLDRILLGAFSRMIEQTPNVDRWFIPLSGGHDSRLIVNYLNQLGSKNVICFSYGAAGNEQSEISKKVANVLGYEWHFVEYTEQKWARLHDLDIIKDYLRYSSNGVSTPHLQDFLAVYELKEKGILKQNDVFVPGHTFDWLAGSKLFDADFQCQDESAAVKRVISMHTSIQDSASAPGRKISEIFRKSDVQPQNFQEYFNWQERRTKFMANSVRCYEFFDFEYRLPFWDKELAEFWRETPDNQRKERSGYFLAEEIKLLDQNLIQIPFFGKRDKKTKDTGLEKILKLLLPGFIKTLLLKSTGRKSEFNAGLNQIYSLREANVKDVIGPVEDFPVQTRRYFKDFLNRYPFQMDYHFLTTLYSIRIQFDRKKNTN